LYAKQKIRRTDRVKDFGFTLLVHPTVFHPKLYFSSQILGQYVAGLNLKNKRVLDMGTGSGIIGLCAAGAGADVVSVDVNPIAVECARKNAELNSLGEKIECRDGNLFSTIQVDERFDYILWNPPFYLDKPKDRAGHAWNAGENYTTIEQFATQASRFLAPSGKVAIILSSDVDAGLILSFFSRLLYSHEIRMTERKLFEVLTIHEFSLSTSVQGHP
jgi:release factor glutamine methyltransferase